VPAAKGEIIVIVLLGHCSAAVFDCAKADVLAQAANNIALAMIERMKIFFIEVSIFFLETRVCSGSQFFFDRMIFTKFSRFILHARFQNSCIFST
jgi:hypothetical protein